MNAIIYTLGITAARLLSYFRQTKVCSKDFLGVSPYQELALCRCLPPLSLKTHGGKEWKVFQYFCFLIKSNVLYGKTLEISSWIYTANFINLFKTPFEQFNLKRRIILPLVFSSIRTSIYLCTIRNIPSIINFS